MRLPTALFAIVFLATVVCLSAGDASTEPVVVARTSSVLLKHGGRESSVDHLPIHLADSKLVRVVLSPTLSIFECDWSSHPTCFPWYEPFRSLVCASVQGTHRQCQCLYPEGVPCSGHPREYSRPLRSSRFAFRLAFSRFFRAAMFSLDERLPGGGVCLWTLEFVEEISDSPWILRFAMFCSTVGSFTNSM